MSKLVFLLFVALVAKASHAAPNPSPSNSRIEKIIDDQCKNASQTLSTKFDEMTSKIRNDEYEFLVSMTSSINNVYETLRSISVSNFGVLAAQYRNHTISEKCYLPLRDLQLKISDFDKTSTDCKNGKDTYFDDHFNNMKKIKDNAGQNINNIKESASTCVNDECLEIKKRELNHVVDKALQDVRAAIEVCDRGAAENKKSFEDCLDLEGTSNKYKQEVQQGLDNYKICAASE